MSIWRWSDRIEGNGEGDGSSGLPRVTRGEGDTPLIRSNRLGPSVGLNNLWFKVEGANPTGSYKDRFAAAAIEAMRRRGQRHVIATSSGNTGAAVAAYAAAAGMTCEIAVVEPAPEEKLRQMRAYGARVYKVRGFGLDAAVTARVFADVEARARLPGNALQISAFKYSPDGMRGVQTVSYEIYERLPGVSHVFAPAGGGGLVLAVARGFADVKRREGAKAAAVHCVQPEGNDTIATPLRTGMSAGRGVTCTSAISGLQVPSVIDADAAIEACRRSGGTGHVVADADVWALQRRLAVEEGLFVEPAAAVAVVGAVGAVSRGEVAADDIIVALLTGVGFKDSASVTRMIGDAPCEIIEPDDVAASSRAGAVLE